MYSRLNYVQSGHFISRVRSSGSVNVTAVKCPATQMVRSQKSSCGNALHGAEDLGALSLQKEVGRQSEAIFTFRANACNRERAGSKATRALNERQHESYRSETHAA